MKAVLICLIFQHHVDNVSFGFQGYCGSCPHLDKLMVLYPHFPNPKFLFTNSIPIEPSTLPSKTAFSNLACFEDFVFHNIFSILVK